VGWPHFTPKLYPLLVIVHCVTILDGSWWFQGGIESKFRILNNLEPIWVRTWPMGTHRGKRVAKVGRLDRAISRMEIRIVLKALEITGNNKEKAGKLLGCARSRINAILNNHGRRDLIGKSLRHCNKATDNKNNIDRVHHKNKNFFGIHNPSVSENLE